MIDDSQAGTYKYFIHFSLAAHSGGENVSAMLNHMTECLQSYPLQNFEVSNLKNFKEVCVYAQYQCFLNWPGHWFGLTSESLGHFFNCRIIKSIADPDKKIKNK